MPHISVILNFKAVFFFMITECSNKMTVYSDDLLIKIIFVM